MKKLLALVLVLGMASMASAGLQISVHPADGSDPTWDPMNPQDSEIVVKPSDTLILDIWTDEPILVGGFPTFAMLTANQFGSISGGEYVGPVDGTNISTFLDRPEVAGITGIPEDENGVGGFVGVLDGAGIEQAGTVLFDGILFHCEAEGDAIITLWNVDLATFAISDIADQVVIHQIPEPLTMSLLGLGGLALLRRRRA